MCVSSNFRSRELCQCWQGLVWGVKGYAVLGLQFRLQPVVQEASTSLERNEQLSLRKHVRLCSVQFSKALNIFKAKDSKGKMSAGDVFHSGFSPSLFPLPYTPLNPNPRFSVYSFCVYHDILPCVGANTQSWACSVASVVTGGMLSPSAQVLRTNVVFSPNPSLYPLQPDASLFAVLIYSL